MFPRISPAEPLRLAEPFDCDDFLFELKDDGFRAIAYVRRDAAVQLVSRKDHVYKSFTRLCGEIGKLGRDAVLDGEITCLDREGRSLVYSLLYRRGELVLYAFDCLWLDGRDLRDRPLVERKRMLKGIVPPGSRILYAQHIDAEGVRLFEEVCRRDLEGIIGKWKHGAYGQGWVKVRNPRYSQLEGRRELFQKRRSQAGSASG